MKHGTGLPRGYGCVCSSGKTLIDPILHRQLTNIFCVLVYLAKKLIIDPLFLFCYFGHFGLARVHFLIFALKNKFKDGRSRILYSW